MKLSQSDALKLFIYGSIADILTTFAGWMLQFEEVNPAGFGWVLGVNITVLLLIVPIYSKFMKHSSYKSKAKLWVDRTLYGVGMFKIVIATLNFINIVAVVSR